MIKPSENISDLNGSCLNLFSFLIRFENNDGLKKRSSLFLI